MFTATLALECRKSGLVTIRHDKICDLFCELSSFAWKNVVKEPTLQEPSSTQSTEGLAADFAVRGVWQQQCTTMFDVQIVDTDSPSYFNESPLNVLTTAENENKRKSSKAYEARYCYFTPLCLSINGLMGGELNSLFQTLSQSPLHHLGTTSQFN